MDHHFVDRDAGACGEAVKVQERGLRSLTDNKVVNGSVNCLGRYAGFHQLARKGPGTGRDPTGSPHRLNFTFIFDRDHAFAPMVFRISSLAPSMDWLPLTMCSRPSFA